MYVINLSFQIKISKLGLATGTGNGIHDLVDTFLLGILPASSTAEPGQLVTMFPSMTFAIQL